MKVAKGLIQGGGRRGGGWWAVRHNAENKRLGRIYINVCFFSFFTLYIELVCLNLSMCFFSYNKLINSVFGYDFSAKRTSSIFFTSPVFSTLFHN
jgi:hypothetical protein